MTVQELLEFLYQVEDKTKEVILETGTTANGYSSKEVESVSEDCKYVIIYNKWV
jgi:hypothetical protein